MTRYAENTGVSTDASRAEIERTLRRYGANQFIYGWDRDSAVVGFRAVDRQVKFVLPLPDRADPEFTTTPGRKLQRSGQQAEAAWEQACRQRWRALALAIKAKLEAVESAIATFDDEFLAYVVLPNGQTVGEWGRPQLERAYTTASMPALLPAGAIS